MAVASVAVACLATRVHALDPERAVSQYIRDRWGSERGFPGGPVYALTQTDDGYLWAATEKGLVRFDGLSFKLFDTSGLTAGTGPTVLGVASAPDGSLWARLRGPALFRMHDGAFQSLFSEDGLTGSVVTAMLRGRAGALLIATLNRGALSYRDGRFTPIAAPSSVPMSSFIIAIAEGAGDDVWLGTRDAGLLLVEGTRVTRIREGLPDPKVNCLLAGERGEVWIGTDRGIARWTGSEVSSAGVPPALGDVPALAMIRDRQSNIWIAAGARGLYRVNARGVSTLGVPGGASVTSLFEDREGNVWVGTTKGIERLRDGIFTTYGVAQGLSSDGVGPVHGDAARRLWFGPADGGLAWLENGRINNVADAGLRDDVVYSIAGNGSDVWVGRQRGGLTHVTVRADGTIVREQFTQANGLAQNSVYAVFQARDGAVWAGTLSGGVSRLRNGAFTTFTTADGLASNTVAAIAEGADGAMWFATPNGISVWSGGEWRHVGASDGLPSNDVNVLFEDSARNVWAGTAGGLAVFRRGELVPQPTVPPVFRGPVLGIAEDRNGWLWIATGDHIARVHANLETATIAIGALMRDFTIADGLATVEGVKRNRSVIADRDGRVWMATGRGLSMADPGPAGSAAPASLVQIEEIAADGSPLDLRTTPRVPAGRRRVTLGYNGLSLALPERVRFRYRLDGFDPEWSEPVAERQAVYTNLNPGSYTFRVNASNPDGLWNGSEASIRFEVEPATWQAAWFQLSLVGLALTSGWALYRLRVARMTHELHVRFEDRLAERTRIAQALHDTLLQGFISASMQLHVAVDRLPASSDARQPLGRVLDLMSRVIDEGRNAVQGLRAADSGSRDLAESFSAVQEELVVTPDVDHRVIIDGRARPLNAVIRDEVYRIGREALVNAFRHAEAGSVELQLEYASKHLRLLVRDDGKGIDEDVLRAGREGHWGLPGMRERAEAIGGTLKLRSRSGAGTEVELTIPARVAYAEATGARAPGWTRVFRR